MPPPSASFCSYHWIQVSIFPFSILFFPTHKRKEERKKRTDDQRCCQKKRKPRFRGIQVPLSDMGENRAATEKEDGC